MMKKLLILALLLGLVTTVNATLSLDTESSSVAVSESFTVEVLQDTAEPDAFWIGVSGPASYSGYGTLYIPPATSTLVLSDGGYGAGWIQASLSSPSTTGAIGKWYDLELTATGDGEIVIDLYDSSGYTIIDTLTVTVPEPITVALLGIGGLLLRRRK